MAIVNPTFYIKLCRGKNKREGTNGLIFASKSNIEKTWAIDFSFEHFLQFKIMNSFKGKLITE